ncbi:DnaJ-domain-containing protein [Ascodesmis nigricans]|uniref:DnaJ-domain-containing protein n=1 Tax=Ascodesmis nigricans TaxID=341454 RepID=A0A4S2N279_9PEZI|nr:DnaJ-domain-containing protein [Ascodesmis nigricans]
MPPNESEAAVFATTSDVDFYDILQIPQDAITESSLRKAFRKQSLKWHPDKNDSAEAVEKFHLLTTAYDVLSDPATKAAYDNARAARLAKKRRNEAFDLERRRMQADLESRENRTKRAKVDPEGEFAAAFSRLKEEGARLRQKREEALRAAAKEAEEQAAKEAEEAGKEEIPASRFTELDRTVTVKWRRKGDGETLDESALRKLFERFGKIQDVVIRKGGGEKKLRNGLIVFESIVGAHAAVRDALNGVNPAFKPFKVVSWAAGKEPDISGIRLDDHGVQGKDPPINPTPPSADGKELPKSPRRAWEPPSASNDGSKKVPSFGSFNLPKSGSLGSQFSKSQMAQSPDYESITLMRMRDAEKRRLEEEIRRQEQAAEDGTE